MRVYFSLILFFVLMGLFTIANAQVTAVMEARVNIISAVGITQFQSFQISANSRSGAEEQTGSFSVKATPGADIDVRVREDGAKTNWQQNSNAETGEHTVTLETSEMTDKEVREKGAEGIVAVVEYL